MIGFVPGSMVELHSKARRRKYLRNLRRRLTIRQRIDTLRALLQLDTNVEVDKIIRNTTLTIQLLLIQTDDVFENLFSSSDASK